MELPCQRFKFLINIYWLLVVHSLFFFNIINYQKGTAPLCRALVRRRADRLQRGYTPTPAHCTISFNGMPAHFEVLLFRIARRQIRASYQLNVQIQCPRGHTYI